MATAAPVETEAIHSHTQQKQYWIERVHNRIHQIQFVQVQSYGYCIYTHLLCVSESESVLRPFPTLLLIRFSWEAAYLDRNNVDSEKKYMGCFFFSLRAASYRHIDATRRARNESAQLANSQKNVTFSVCTAFLRRAQMLGDHERHNYTRTHTCTHKSTDGYHNSFVPQTQI